MNSKHDDRSEFRCPKSGQVLGAFVKAFRLDDSAVGGSEPARVFGSKQSQRYFAGEWLVESRRIELCTAVGETTSSPRAIVPSLRN